MKTFRRHSRECNADARLRNTEQPPRGELGDPEPLNERHYSVQQLADSWNMSSDFVRRLFCNEPGVTEWVQQRRGRRRYRVIRIPESVAVRVYRRALAAAATEDHPHSF